MRQWQVMPHNEELYYDAACDPGPQAVKQVSQSHVMAGFEHDGFALPTSHALKQIVRARISPCWHRQV